MGRPAGGCCGGRWGACVCCFCEHEKTAACHGVIITDFLDHGYELHMLSMSC